MQEMFVNFIRKFPYKLKYLLYVFPNYCDFFAREMDHKN